MRTLILLMIMSTQSDTGKSPEHSTGELERADGLWWCLKDSISLRNCPVTFLNTKYQRIQEFHHLPSIIILFTFTTLKFNSHFLKPLLKLNFVHQCCLYKTVRLEFFNLLIAAHEVPFLSHPLTSVQLFSNFPCYFFAPLRRQNPVFLSVEVFIFFLFLHLIQFHSFINRNL